MFWPSLQVGRHYQHTAAVLAKPGREFAARRGLARALQAAHHDDGGAGVRGHEMLAHRPHQLDERAVHDFDHLLARANTLQHGFAHGFGLHFFAEGIDDFKAHVRIEQGGPHLRHRVPDIGLADTALSRESVNGTGQPI